MMLLNSDRPPRFDYNLKAKSLIARPLKGSVPTKKEQSIAEVKRRLSVDAP